MRFAVAILGLAGCRSLLGFDEVVRVDDASPSDSAVDALLIDGAVDAPPDTPAATCPLDFMTITDGQANHKYKLATTQDGWDILRAGCVTSGGYLAIPDSETELTAIVTLGSNNMWIGVSDQLLEGTMQDVLNNVYAALPFNNNTPTRDCGVAKDNNPQLEVENCDNNHTAVCECNE